MSYDDPSPALTAAEARLLLETGQAQQKLSIGRTKLFELLASGEIESVKIGRSRRIPADALDEYVRRLRTEQAAEHAIDAA